jgi:hypothetical protein
LTAHSLTHHVGHLWHLLLLVEHIHVLFWLSLVGLPTESNIFNLIYLGLVTIVIDLCAWLRCSLLLGCLVSWCLIVCSGWLRLGLLLLLLIHLGIDLWIVCNSIKDRSVG